MGQGSRSLSEPESLELSYEGLVFSRHYSSAGPSRGLSDAYRNTTIAVKKRGMKTREIVLSSFMRIWRLGPAVSFQGSPTVSPTTVAACVSVFLPPRCPSSMYFFALSIAAPPHIIMIARGIAERVAPTTRADRKSTRLNSSHTA